MGLYSVGNEDHRTTNNQRKKAIAISSWLRGTLGALLAGTGTVHFRVKEGDARLHVNRQSKLITPHIVAI